MVVAVLGVAVEGSGALTDIYITGLKMMGVPQPYVHSAIILGNVLMSCRRRYETDIGD